MSVLLTLPHLLSTNSCTIILSPGTGHYQRTHRSQTSTASRRSGPVWQETHSWGEVSEEGATSVSNGRACPTRGHFRNRRHTTVTWYVFFAFNQCERTHSDTVNFFLVFGVFLSSFQFHECYLEFVLLYTFFTLNGCSKNTQMRILNLTLKLCLSICGHTNA